MWIGGVAYRWIAYANRRLRVRFYNCKWYDLVHTCHPHPRRSQLLVTQCSIWSQTSPGKTWAHSMVIKSDSHSASVHRILWVQADGANTEWHHIGLDDIYILWVLGIYLVHPMRIITISMRLVYRRPALYPWHCRKLPKRHPGYWNQRKFWNISEQSKPFLFYSRFI